MHLLAMRLPGSRTRAVAVLALFAAVQLADGVMTYVALARYGPAAEGNPLLAFFMAECGAGSTLVASKLMALACGVVLFVWMRHRTLAALTVGYVFAALAPWAWALG